MPSQTNEQALEAAIENRIAGICQEELKHRDTNASMVEQGTDLYRVGIGYYIGSPTYYNAKNKAGIPESVVFHMPICF